MKRDKKEIFIPWLVILYTWPFFPAWVTLLQRNWLMLPFMAAVGFLFVPDYFRSKTFIRSLFFFFVLIFGFLIGSHYYSSIVLLFCSICSYIAVSAYAWYFSKMADETQRKLLSFATILFIVFSTLASYYICRSYPNIIRYSANGENEDAYRAFVISLQRYGLSSFDVVHALPILIPVLILGFKSVLFSVWKKFFFLALAVICVFQTYISGSATPFLLSILVFIASLVVHVGSLRSNYRAFVIFITLCFIFLSPEVLSKVISFISSILGADSGELQMRLTNVDEAITTGSTDTGDMGARVNLYQLSLNAFYSNILFGSRTMPLGGHSFMLDTLGAYGLVGFLMLLSFVVSLLKNIINQIPPKYVPFYGLSIFAAIIMLATKNTGTWGTWCFLLIISPVFLQYIISTSSKK